MKKLILLFGLILPSFCIAQSLEEKVLEAIMATEKGEFELAISKYDSLIQENPNILALYVLKGEAYTKFDRKYTTDKSTYYESVKCYEQALAIDSTFFQAHKALGLLNIYHQEFQKAVIHFSNAIAYAPTKEDLFNSLTDRGAAFIYLESYQPAIQDYEQALKLNPNAIGVYANVAMIYKRQENYEKAKELCMKGLEMSPTDGTLLNNLGLIYIEEKKYAEAIDLYNQLLDANDEDPIALSNRGFAKTKLGKYEEATSDLNRSIEIYPENSYAYKNRAILFFELKENEKGCQDLSTAKKLGYGNMFGDEVDLLLKSKCDQ